VVTIGIVVHAVAGTARAADLQANNDAPTSGSATSPASTSTDTSGTDDAKPVASPSALPVPADGAPAPGEADAVPHAVDAKRSGMRTWRAAATVGIVSLPRVLSLEALWLMRRASDPARHHYGFGLGIEYLPRGLVSFGPKTDFSWLQIGADARFFPWRFVFVGARIGLQVSRTDSEKFGSEVDYITSSFFFAPKVGVLHTFENRITIGADLGATIPIGASTTLESDGTEDSSARKASKTFGAFVMPFASLFRIGYAF
jgi:hypothetical protein